MLSLGSHFSLRRLVGAALAVAVLGGVALLGWAWRHPHAFDEAGGWGMAADHQRVGDTLYAGMSYPRHHGGGHLTLHGGHANIDSGAHNADVELLLCTINPDGQVGAIGSYRGDSIHDGCTDLVPIHDGQRMDLQEAPLRQQIVLAVTLTRPGTVVISDITVDYSYGWRRGSQRVGGQIVMSTGAING